jgi:hypothetical protein
MQAARAGRGAWGFVTTSFGGVPPNTARATQELKTDSGERAQHRPRQHRGTDSARTDAPAPAPDGVRYAVPKTNKSFLSTVACDVSSSNSD